MTIPAITQAMIDAYDEYTHLTLDRRGFMEKLTRLAGSGAAAAAIAPLLAADPAAAEIVPADDARLKGEDITWAGPAGDMMGYLVGPADQNGKLPTVIVIHENRGLNATRTAPDDRRICPQSGYVAGKMSLMYAAL